MNNLKKTDNIHIFCASNIFFFFFMNATPMLRPSFSARPIFDRNFRRPFYVPCNASFSYVQNKKRNKIWVLPCLRHLLFYFSSGRVQLWQKFFKTLIQKRNSLMVRPWCTHSVFLTSAHNHSIPTHTSFLATRSSLHPLRFRQSVVCCSMLNDRLFFS